MDCADTAWCHVVSRLQVPDTVKKVVPKGLKARLVALFGRVASGLGLGGKPA